MKLLQDVLQFFRDRQAQVCTVFQDTQAFIGEIEEDHSRPKDTSGSDHVDVDHLSNPHQQEDDHFPADSLEAFLAVEPLVDDRAHDTGDIVCGDKYHEGEQ